LEAFIDPPHAPFRNKADDRHVAELGAGAEIDATHLDWRRKKLCQALEAKPRSVGALALGQLVARIAREHLAASVWGDRPFLRMAKHTRGGV
jgi:hypothetical protein